MATIVLEEQFVRAFSEKLGDQYDRALSLFKNCGKNLSYDVTNVLLHAVDKDKVDEVLWELEKHYKDHLESQHPEVRGTINTKKTQNVFIRICEDILELQPN